MIICELNRMGYTEFISISLSSAVSLSAQLIQVYYLIRGTIVHIAAIGFWRVTYMLNFMHVTNPTKVQFCLSF